MTRPKQKSVEIEKYSVQHHSVPSFGCILVGEEGKRERNTSKRTAWARPRHGVSFPLINVSQTVDDFSEFSCRICIDISDFSWNNLEQIIKDKATSHYGPARLGYALPTRRPPEPSISPKSLLSPFRPSSPKTAPKLASL